MGRWHKGMIASSTISVGLVDWDVAIQTLRGFIGVQRWLNDGKGGGKTNIGNTLKSTLEGDEKEKGKKRAASV